MKKLVFFVFIFLIVFFSIPVIGQGTQQGEKEDYQVIPDDAIRLRILANSDDENDQQIKRLIRDHVNEEITEWVEDINDIDKARELIQNRIPDINSIVKNTLQEHGASYEAKVEYGKNVSFPTKIYGSYLYPAGKYEAVLITVGEGQGDNWWCVLFPPLCFLDFASGISVAEASTDQMEEKEEEPVKIKFFLFDWLGWS